MATHSSILAWKIPRTEEPDGLQSWGCKESDTTKQLSTVLSYKGIPPLCLRPWQLSWAWRWPGSRNPIQEGTVRRWPGPWPHTWFCFVGLSFKSYQTGLGKGSREMEGWGTQKRWAGAVWPPTFSLYTLFFFNKLSLSPFFLNFSFDFCFKNISLFFFWLCWVLVAVRLVCLVAVSRGHPLLGCLLIAVA